LIDTPGRALDRDAGRDRRLPGRVLALPGGEDLPQDHLGHLGAGDPRPLERLADCNLAEVVGRQVSKCAIECPNRGTGRARNDNIVFHVLGFLCSDQAMRSIWHARDTSCVCNRPSLLPMAVGGWRVNETKGQAGLRRERAAPTPWMGSTKRWLVRRKVLCLSSMGRLKRTRMRHVNGPRSRSLAIKRYASRRLCHIGTELP